MSNTSARGLAQLPANHRGTISVPTPRAQNNTLCDGQSPEVRRFYQNALNFFEKSDWPKEIKAIAWIMMDEGLRISEALNIAPHHVLSNRKIKIIGLKGSRNRIISVTQYWGYWESYKRQSCCINQVYNRFFFYRLFKKHGLSMDLVNSNRKAVTHSFRHAYIKQLKAEGIATELTAAEIGHKSTKSTQHYEEQ